MQKLVSREDWGARLPRCSAPLPVSAIRAMVVHYSAADADEQAQHANCAARVRGIQRYHMNTQGWCDLAYNRLVCKHGYTFQGRGWAKRSAATGPANGYTVAVCFLGDDTPGRDDVTDAGRVAITRNLADLRRYTERAIPAKGHRDFMSTRCPGNQLYAWLEVLNA